MIEIFIRFFILIIGYFKKGISNFIYLNISVLNYLEIYTFASPQKELRGYVEYIK